MSGAGDELGADPVGVHGGRGEGGDGVLVEVGGDDDAGAGGAEVVELLAHPVGDEEEVAGVDADGAQLGSGDLDGGADGFGDVVGVHEEGGAPAEGVDLGLEGVPLVVVEQGEGVGAVPTVGMP